MVGHFQKSGHFQHQVQKHEISAHYEQILVELLHAINVGNDCGARATASEMTNHVQKTVSKIVFCV